MKLTILLEIIACLFYATGLTVLLIWGIVSSHKEKR